MVSSLKKAVPISVEADKHSLLYIYPFRPCSCSNAQEGMASSEIMRLSCKARRSLEHILPRACKILGAPMEIDPASHRVVKPALWRKGRVRAEDCSNIVLVNQGTCSEELRIMSMSKWEGLMRAGSLYAQRE